MTKDNATKRPWKVFQEDTIINDDGVYVGRCDWSPTPDKANARLIVNAVNCHDDLVEVLKIIKNHLEYSVFYSGIPSEITNKIEQALKKASQ